MFTCPALIFCVNLTAQLFCFKIRIQPQLASANPSELQQHVVAAAAAVERRSSPSDAPQGDWPCVVVGSGFTTQQRLRSPPPGMLGPRPSLLLKAAKTPSPRRLYRMAAIKPDLHASESPEGQSLRMQGCGEELQPRNERRRD